MSKAAERGKKIIIDERKVNQRVKLGYKDEPYMTEAEMIAKSKHFKLNEKKLY